MFDGRQAQRGRIEADGAVGLREGRAGRRRAIEAD